MVETIIRTDTDNFFFGQNTHQNLLGQKSKGCVGVCVHVCVRAFLFKHTHMCKHAF